MPATTLQLGIGSIVIFTINLIIAWLIAKLRTTVPATQLRTITPSLALDALLFSFIEMGVFVFVYQGTWDSFIQKGNDIVNNTSEALEHSITSIKTPSSAPPSLKGGSDSFDLELGF